MMWARHTIWAERTNLAQSQVEHDATCESSQLFVVSQREALETPTMAPNSIRGEFGSVYRESLGASVRGVGGVCTRV